MLSRLQLCESVSCCAGELVLFATMKHAVSKEWMAGAWFSLAWIRVYDGDVLRLCVLRLCVLRCAVMVAASVDGRFGAGCRGSLWSKTVWEPLVGR